jgi:peptidyl-prolyl cis-trans isomerase B (cyclophilin B)
MGLFGEKLKSFEALPEGAQPKVSIELEKGGKIEMELYPDVAPQHVASFLDLISKGFYDGLLFHRVVPGFVVQGGCPKGSGIGGPGYRIKAEFNAKPHLSGSLAMARSSDPDSAGSQFYICLEPQPSLDGNYTVFGQVTEGFEHVQEIRQGDKMSKVTLLSK